MSSKVGNCTNQAAGGTIKQQYAIAGSVTGHFLDRWLEIVPTRVS